MSFFSLPASTPPIERLLLSSLTPSQLNLPFPLKPHNQVMITKPRNVAGPLIKCCSNSSSPSSSPSTTTTTTTPTTPTTPTTTPTTTTGVAPPVMKKRKRYRKGYPGETNGISEEMRFVAMRLRNIKGKYSHKNSSSDDEEDGSGQDSENDSVSEKEDEEEGSDDGETWVPSMEGFVKYLVDSRLLFDTVERIVDKSDDVSYAYFRRTGLERAEGLAKDIEWFTQQDVVIPEPSSPGVTYAKYLEELAENNPPLFLCHFYNIYFSHIAGGQVISKQVSEKLLEGRVLDFYRWDGDAEELLKGVREKLNMLGKHWTRDEKNKCLKEATKAFRYLGQIVRLIIL